MNKDEKYEQRKAMYDPETDGDYEVFCKNLAKELHI